MQIEGFTLENYKAFAQKAAFSIRPITLFFGYNSAGKSAALRFLKLLADSSMGASFSPLNLASEAVRRSDFSSLLSKHNSTPRLTFSLNFDSTEITYTILNIPEWRTHIIQRLEIISLESSKKFTLDWNPKDWDSANTNSQGDASEYVFFGDEEEIYETKVIFDGLVPITYSDELKRFLEPLAEQLTAFSRNFVALSPDCIIPERYHLETTPAKRISTRGEGIISLLQSADEGVILDISDWYQKATGYSLVRSDVTIGSRSGQRFTLHPNADPAIDIDITDTGEGMGQVLPVVSVLTLAQHDVLGPNPVISLEHPELHIHPDAHAHLANLFCKVINENPECKILVETHSENLLLGVQLAIARGELEPSDVAVHWIRGTERGAFVELVEFDEGARPSKNNWPIDVYSKNSKLARELFETRKKKET
jgi:AAA domain, putative AbiEii toxin, Type IV TA system